MTLKYFNVKNGLTTGNITLNASNGNIVGSKFSGNIAVTASANLGAVGNLVITGGSNGQVLTTSGNGSVSWTTVEPLSAPTVVLNSFSGTGEQSQFVLNTTPESINFTLVNIDGVSQIHDAYSLVGNTITFDDPPNSGSVIEVMIFIGGSAGGGGGSANVAGTNTQVQYNDNGSLGASAGLTFDSSTTTLTANNFIATSTANLGAVGNITVTGGTLGQVLSSDGSGGLSWANISGSASGTYATRAYTGNGVQTTFAITSGMTVDSVIVTENGIVQKPVTDYTVSGTTLSFTEAPSNNISIQIRELAYGGGSSASVAGSNTQLQFNNAGNLGASAGLTFNSSTTTLAATNLSVTGNTSLTNVILAGNIIPTLSNTYSLGSETFNFKDVYIGPGSLYINGSKVLEEVSNAIIFTADLNQTVRLSTSGTGDIELLPSGTGVISVQGPLRILAGENITSSNGTKIGFSNPIGVDSITTLTANTELVISGNGSGNVKIDDDLTITGNLILQGTTGNLSVTNLVVQDNIIDISAETLGAPTSNAGIRVIRGDEPSTLVRWTESLTSWQFTNDGTNYLSIIGRDSLGNTSLGNVALANYFVGNGSQLTGLTLSTISGANVTGTVANAAYAVSAGSATTAGTVTTAAQPNITSVGSLTELTVTGNLQLSGADVSLGNISNLHIAGGSANYVLSTDGTGNLAWTPQSGGGGGTSSAAAVGYSLIFGG